jgi:hypothetical protein
VNTNLNADLLDGQHGSYYATASSLGNYLPLTGGMLTSDSHLMLCINRVSTTTRVWIAYLLSNDLLGYLGIGYGNLNPTELVGDSVNPIFQRATGVGYVIWHQGNQGAGSGMDADLLDGQHGSYYATAASLNNYLPLAGGTLSNANFGQQLVVERTSNENTGIGFKNSSGMLGYLTQASANEKFRRYTGAISTYYWILDTSDTSVSKSGETLTVTIAGTALSLTNTDHYVTQSSTTTEKWRPIVLGYNYGSKSSSDLYATVTNQVYTVNTLQFQSSTGTLSTTNLSVENNETVAGTLSVTGATTISSTLTMGGHITMSNSNIYFNAEYGIHCGNAMLLRMNSAGSTVLSGNERNIYFRPNGSMVSTEQVTIDTSGIVTCSGISSGKINISYAPTAYNDSPLTIASNTISTSHWPISAFASSAAAGARLTIGVGKAASYYNSVFFGYYHVGDGSTSNYATIGMYGAPDLFVVRGDGRVGIGTTTPSYKLHVDGNGYYGGILYTNQIINLGSTAYAIRTRALDGANVDGTQGDLYINHNHTGNVYISGIYNGLVGIGTLSPSYKLHVAGTFYVGNTATFGSNIVSSNSGGAIEGFQSWELNTHNTAGTNIGGFLDFHYNGTAQDYSVRLIEKDYSGVLQILAKDTGTGNAQRAGLIVGAGTYTSFIQIGNGRIVWNDSDHALRIVDKDGNACNLYATGGISALGYQSGGGGGGSTGVFSTNITPDTTGTYDIGTSTYKWRNLYLAGANGGNGFSITTSYSSYVYIGSLNKIIFGADVEFEDTAYVENRMGIGVRNGNYDLFVNGENEGNAYFAGDVSVASLTNRSDMRLKDVVGDVNLSVQQIASAPTFKFRFKEKAKRTMVGTSAQYWDAVLPESVTRDADGILGLDYGVTALVSTIILAKGMTEHERRITKLEKENAELRARIKDLEEN